jgi:AraC-like DNA-binding protein
MQDEQPYLDPGLSLRGLADLVGIHPNKLSWLINQKMNKNFNEFVNHYRVEHFKRLAGDPDNAHISLIGLAYESGFNSKTVFNTYFKKETGRTPSAYLKG